MSLEILLLRITIVIVLEHWAIQVHVLALETSPQAHFVLPLPCCDGWIILRKGLNQNIGANWIGPRDGFFLE